MVRLNTTGSTRVRFYSPSLVKRTPYNSGNTVKIIDPYTQTAVVSSDEKSIGWDRFMHQVIFNASEFTALEENRKYDLVIERGGVAVHRDTAIYTSQDITHETPHEFAYNHGQYTYLNRGTTVNTYKVLAR